MPTPVLEKPVVQNPCASCSCWEPYPRVSIVLTALFLEGDWGRCSNVTKAEQIISAHKSDTLIEDEGVNAYIYGEDNGIILSTKDTYTCEQYRRRKKAI